MKPSKINKLAAAATLVGSAVLAGIPEAPPNSHPEVKPNFAQPTSEEGVTAHQAPSALMLEEADPNKALVIENHDGVIQQVDPVSGQPMEATGLPHIAEQQAQIGDASVQMQGQEQTTRQ